MYDTVTDHTWQVVMYGHQVDFQMHGYLKQLEVYSKSDPKPTCLAEIICNQSCSDDPDAHKVVGAAIDVLSETLPKK